MRKPLKQRLLEIGCCVGGVKKLKGRPSKKMWDRVKSQDKRYVVETLFGIAFKQCPKFYDRDAKCICCKVAKSYTWKMVYDKLLEVTGGKEEKKKVAK